MTILHFLDHHNGAITSIATILLVGLTAIYVLLNKRLADETARLTKATNNMVAEMTHQWRATQESDIWARYSPKAFGGNGEYYDLVVENFGPSTAFNVRFTANPEWHLKTENGKSLGLAGMLASCIPALSSGQQRKVGMKLKADNNTTYNPLQFTAYWRNALGEEKHRDFELRPSQIAHESEVQLS